MKKPSMTLRFGAAHNSLTIHEGGRDTVIDMNVLTRDDRERVRRMAVTAWEKINPAHKRRGKKPRRAA